MNIDKPEALWLLLGLIPLSFVFFADLLHARKTLTILENFGLQSVFRSTHFFKWFVSLFIFVLFYISLVLGLCGISWGEQPVEEDRRNVDLVFVVDVSRSMLAADASPTRLGRAISMVKDILTSVPLARVALVAFKGRAIPLIPLTVDHSALENALGSLSPSLASASGTKPEEGLDIALSSFVKGSNRHRMVVFLSDGEGFNPQASALAHRAGTEGIPIFCVGLGSEAGSRIILPDGTAVLDTGGSPVQTHLDKTALTTISRYSGGAYIADAGGDTAVHAVLSELNLRVQQSEKNGFHLVAIDRHTVFILIAILILGLFVWFRALHWKVQP